jgi:hypothetical protein
MINRQISTAKTLSSSIAALALGCAFVASTTQAAVLIPTKGGFSGYFNLGVGGVEVESNMLSTIAGGNVDIGDKILDNLNDSPSSDSVAIPTINFELSYTFESTRTQLHIGNLMEDFLSFDSSTLAGVRQDIGRAGLIGASVQASSPVGAQVWRDPYETGTKRNDTDRTSKGGRLYWQQIMGSGLEIRLTATEIDIDKERSGDSLPLSPAQRKRLDRNGDVIKADFFYEFPSDDKRHLVTPGLGYVDRDLDGEAMANDGVNASLNYIYKYNDTWRWVFNATYADLDHKKTNPIYGVKDSANSYGASATFFYTEPFGWKDWAFNGTAGYFEEDHDINFYDTTGGLISVGMFRTFLGISLS